MSHPLTYIFILLILNILTIQPHTLAISEKACSFKNKQSNKKFIKNNHSLFMTPTEILLEEFNNFFAHTTITLDNIRDHINYQDHQGRVFAMYVAEKGELNLFLELLSLGVNLHIKDNHNNSILEYAVNGLCNSDTPQTRQDLWQLITILLELDLFDNQYGPTKEASILEIESICLRH